MKILKQLEAIIEKEGLNESAKQFYLREPVGGINQ